MIEILCLFEEKVNEYNHHHHPKTGKQQTIITNSVQDLCLMTAEKQKIRKKATSKISEMMMLEKIIIKNTKECVF